MILGILLIIFVIGHIWLFKFGNHDIDEHGVKNLFKTVVTEFKDPVFAAFTVILMILLGFHLRHGVWSAFQTMGLDGPRIKRWREPAALLVSLGVVLVNLSFPVVDGEALMLSMRDLAVSSGSACTSASPEPSHVLRALGLGDDLIRGSLRFGLGRFNTQEDVDFAIQRVTAAVDRLRKMSSLSG